MIRNIITTVIFLAALISIASIAQVAKAVEPDLNLNVSLYDDNAVSGGNYAFNHPYTWTPDMAQQKRIINLYERIILPKSIDNIGFVGTSSKDSNQRLFSFEIYQGDGLDDLRARSKHHHSLTLPDEDTSAYGVSVKQRF